MVHQGYLPLAVDCPVLKTGSLGRPGKGVFNTESLFSGVLNFCEFTLFLILPISFGHILPPHPECIELVLHVNHPGLAEIPAPVGSQDVMSQMRDFSFRQ